MRPIDPAAPEPVAERASGPHGEDPLLQVVSFDFHVKAVHLLAEADLAAAREAGHYVWIDVDLARAVEARALLNRLALCPTDVVDDALGREPATQLARYDDLLHLVLTGCRSLGQKFSLERVDVVLGEGFLLTLHRERPVFLENVRRSYRADFLRFAQSPSFLLYELWDHLLDNYIQTHKHLEERVEEVQDQLGGEPDERVFARATELSSDLLHLRKVVLPARTVLTELSTRKSSFVSDATQPFLANMVGTVERVLQDVLVDRDILSSALGNYLALVSHKTGRVMNRLTVVSVIFLPLTFLCGVYGMNFDVLPELRWRYGYLVFWALVVSLAGVLLYLLRRARLL